MLSDTILYFDKFRLVLPHLTTLPHSLPMNLDRRVPHLIAPPQLVVFTQLSNAPWTHPRAVNASDTIRPLSAPAPHQKFRIPSACRLRHFAALTADPAEPRLNSRDTRLTPTRKLRLYAHDFGMFASGQYRGFGVPGGRS